MAELFSWDVESGTIASKFDLDVGTGRSSISTEQNHTTSGSKSLKYVNGSGDSLVVDLGSGHTTIYIRFYWYITTMSTSGNGSGNHGFRLSKRVGDNPNGNGALDTLPMDTGGTQWGFDIFDGGSGQFFDSMNAHHNIVTLPRNQWMKMEMYVNIGTAGSANGTVRVALNDSVIYNRVGTVQFRGSGGTFSQIDTLQLTSNWDNGSMVYYQDDIYVSDTDEIGGGADVTPPVLTSPIAGTPNATGTTGAGVTTNEGTGTLYWAVSASPFSVSDAQLKAGTGGDIVSGKASNQPVTTSGAQTIPAITGLSNSTTYHLHFLHRDSSANDSTPQSTVNLVTTATDVTAPTLSSPNDGTPTSDGTIGASVSTNEGNGTLYWAVVTDGGSATDDQLIAGVGGNIVVGNDQVVNTTGTQTISSTIVGLNDTTDYQILFLHRDASGNKSAQVSVDLTTLPPPSGTIWEDDFETDKSLEYYERNNPPATATWGRSTVEAFSGSWSLRSVADGTPANSNACNSNWWVGFGKLPTVTSWPDYAQASGTSTTAIYTDVTVQFRHRATAWTPYASPSTDDGIKLMRMSVFNGSTGGQAAVLHLWSYSDAGTSGNNERLALDPVSGVTNGLSGAAALAATTVQTTQWNDFANFDFMTGAMPSATHVYSQSNLGHWFLIKVRMKLNTPGVADGIMELWIDGVKEVERTDLNWIGSWTPTHGINTVHLERYWNSGAPGNDVSAFDDFVVLDNSVATDVTGPVISSISSNSPGFDRSTITWTTDESATSVVDYGLTTSYGSTTSSGTLEASHSIALTGLSSGVTYHYRITSVDADDNSTSSADQTFTTRTYGSLRGLA